ncbi:hypothetical protein [Paracoccus sp. (in: a-proteobacteria)]|uniref:hypothetical protein n=1 Tax=Paracoccus sp. TaxID=267 RepID=UPI0026DFDFAA|nr:hypothetical protein [Paracoccus sp. (in: a-proteobacteria)]MDO5369627.1 hypothetical protein [Paracoccus sp. (in: a-proteobacteria)]
MTHLPAAAALLAALTLAAPATAQDYLGIHLDTMLEQNLRTHQQQQASPRESPAPRQGKSRPGAMSPAAEARARAEGARIMQEHRRQLEPRYRMRVGRDGKAAADAWLATEARRFGIETGRAMRKKYSGQ